MKVSRDSVVWWFGIVGSIVSGLAVNLQLFPWIPDQAQHWITFAAFVVGIISGKLATSPLKGEHDAETVSVSKLPPAAMLLLALSLPFLSACGPKPAPVVNPAVTRAQQALQVVKALDVIRDTAVGAAATQPPLLSPHALQLVLVWHESAVKVIDAVPGGWQAAVLAGLDQLKADLPPAEYARIAIYVAAAQAAIGFATVPSGGAW